MPRNKHVWISRLRGAAAVISCCSTTLWLTQQWGYMERYTIHEMLGLYCFRDNLVGHMMTPPVKYTDPQELEWAKRYVRSLNNSWAQKCARYREREYAERI